MLAETCDSWSGSLDAEQVVEPGSVTATVIDRLVAAGRLRAFEQLEVEVEDDQRFECVYVCYERTELGRLALRIWPLNRSE